MKKLRKLAAFLLCAAMILAMGITTFAAGEKASLIVKVNAGNTLNGQTLSVYKLFDVTVSGDKYGYTVNETYKEAIATALGETPATVTSDELYEALAAMTEDSPEIQKFADDFTAAALTGSLAATKTSGTLTDVADYTFTDLDYGYYLVYQTGTEELQSSLVTVAKASEEVDLKGEAPSITKVADVATVQIGQVVTYTVTGTIPDTTGYADYQYIIHDTLTDGLDFVSDKNGTAVSEANLAVSVQIGSEAAEEQTATLSGDGNREMKLDISSWIASKQADKGSTFTVTYYAKVNSNAVVETNNSASLEYGNTPGNTTETTPVKVDTPTYPLDINKTIKDDGNMLAGAKFRLYRSEDDAKADNSAKAIKVTGTSGSYTVAEDQSSGNTDMESVDTAVGTGYNLRLNGLAAGDYWLVETEAPDGYNKITAPVKVTIAKTTATEWTVAKNGTDEADKIIDVENSTGTILPGTGGIGTIIFTVAGAALIIGVAVSFAVSRKNAAAGGKARRRTARRR